MRKAAGPESVSGYIRRTVLGAVNGRAPEFRVHPGVTQPVKASAPLPDPEKFEELGVPEDGAGAKCEHGAEKNQCQVWGCKFYFVANGRGAKRQAPLFESGPEGEDEVCEPENVRRDRDLPVSGRRAAAAVSASRKTAKSKSKGSRSSGRGSRKVQQDRESKGPCTYPTGVGIWCPKCGRQH